MDDVKLANSLASTSSNDVNSTAFFCEPSTSKGITTTNTCYKCRSNFSTTDTLFIHRQSCKGKTIMASFCQSCKRKFSCSLLLHKHRCTKLYSRRKQNKKLLQKNLALAKGWVEKQMMGSSLTCAKCDTKFESKASYQLHTMNGCKNLSCPTCNKNFGTTSKLRSHQDVCKSKLMEKRRKLKKLKKDRVYSCRCCKHDFGIPKQLKDHLQRRPYCTRVHNMKIKLQCMWERGDDLDKTARKSFPSSKMGSSKKYQWELDSNLSDGSDGKPIIGAARKTFPSSPNRGAFCDVCYRYFGSAVALKSHKKKHYGLSGDDVDDSSSKGNYNKCPQCLATFPNSPSLVAHQNEKDHWGKAAKSITTSCVCPVCEKEFLLVESRNAHLRTHVSEYPDEVKEFLDETTCEICSQIFASETIKAQHMRIRHENITGQKYDSSDLIFQSHKYVGYSNKNVLKNVTPTLSDQLKKKPTECPICFRRYSTSFIRNRHFRSHTLDQAFECKFCPTKFPRSDRLTQHMQQEHNDSLAYECKECGLRFLTRMRGLQHCSKAHSHLQAKNIVRERQVPIVRKAAVDGNEAVIPDEEFYCEVCDLSFLKLCGLQKHRQSKLHLQIFEKMQQEEMERPPLSLTPPFIDYSKKLSCSTCTMEFEHVNDFIPHRLSHFSTENCTQIVDEHNLYSCEVCGKIMDNHQTIQLHLFWHLQDVQLQAGPRRSEDDALDIPITKPVKITSKTEVKKELVVAGVKKQLYTCDSCSIGFTTLNHYTIHIQQYCRGNSSAADQKKTPMVTAGFCKICGCIFSSTTLYEEHKTLFCNDHNFPLLQDNAESLYTEMVKSLVKLNTMVAGCVRCNLAFDSMKSLTEHSLKHTVSENGEFENRVDIDLETVGESVKLLVDCKTDNSLESSVKPEDADSEVLDGIDDNIDILRENFCQLLSILVSDQELMEQLGYGKKDIEDVLVNVLEQMGLSPVSLDSKDTKLEIFEKNIRILLDVCIKDQVMELLSNSETTTNSIVLAALKMFKDDASDEDV